MTTPTSKASRIFPDNLWPYTVLVVAIGLRLASGPTANLSYLLLAAYALLGGAHAIRALMLSWLFTMINPGIAPDASAAAAGRYAVLIASSVGIFIRSGFMASNMNLVRTTYYTLLLGIFLIIHSIMFSFMVDISILKVFLWTLAMVSLLSAWTKFTPLERRQVERELFLFLLLVLVAGLPLLNLPAGYLVNGTGFQGVLNQPQAFGVFVTLLGSWTSARILTEHKPSWWLFILAGSCIILIFISESRTAGLALILSFIFSIPLFFILSARPLLHIAPALRHRRIWIVIGFSILAGIGFAPRISATVEHFMTKSDRAQVDGFIDAFGDSRGILIYPMIENITAQPLTGIGFGIASKPQEMEIQRDPIFGLPIGAAVEKGVAPLMIIEELGIIGFLVVSFWVIMIIYRSAFDCLSTFTVCITIFILNLGEASLFSPGGMGLLTIILLGWAASGAPKHRVRNVR